MRLISCHIENFGKLHNETVSFDNFPGINVLCKNNGWGKSTLAAFIKVMFFGFDNEGRRNNVENERQHFRPWQGGVYGGQLTFETAGKRYIISRTFGTKEKDDEFVVQDADTNLTCNNFSKKIGEELFQIDSASFARSIYISQNDCVTSTTDKINAKLGNLSDNTDDLNNYETAVKKIADKLNALSGTRKTGILYKQKEELMRLRQEVKQAEPLEASMEEILKLKNTLHASYENLKDEQKLLQVRQKEISELKDILVKKKEYESLCGDERQKLNLYEEKRRLFPAEIPSQEEIDKYINLEYHTSGLKKNMDFYELNDEENHEFEQLEAVFKDGLPRDGEIESIKDKINILQTLKVKIENSMLSREEKNTLESLKEQFANGIPSKEELDNLSKEWSLRSEKKNTLTSKKSTYDMLKRTEAARAQELHNSYADDARNIDKHNMRNRNRRQNTGRLYTAIVVSLFIAAALIGALLCFMQFSAGIPVLAADVLAAVFYTVMMFRKRKNSKCRGAAGQCSGYGESEEYDSEYGKGREYDSEYEKYVESDDLYADLYHEIKNDEEIIRRAEAGVEQFFSQYHIPYDEEGVIAELYQLKEKVKLYENLKAKLQNSDADRFREEYKNLQDEVDEFMQRYGLGRSIGYDSITNDNVTDGGIRYDNIMNDNVTAGNNGELADNSIHYVNLMHKLEYSISNYLSLINKKDGYKSAYNEYKKNYEEIKTFLEKVDIKIDFEGGYGAGNADKSAAGYETDNKTGSGVPGASMYDMLNLIKDAQREYLRAKSEYETAAGLKNRFEINNKALLAAIQNAETIEEDDSLVDIEERLSEISAEIEKYHTNAALYERRLDELQEKRDEISDSENRLEELQEIYELNEKNYKILQNTQKYLEQAKIALTARYTRPIKEGFDKYFEIICGIESENYQLDANLNMSVIEQGLPRNTAFLSTGYQDMVGICMRMALIDAMYKAEKPFVIFDDPFVNLDNKRTEGALRFLEAVAGEYQVVYFTCNEGRR